MTLCIVIKNEELFLAECLTSARPFVRDMVVVDTGSTDRSIQIARDLGARVFQEPWPGDMAVAHDLPVAHASEPWILTLDGDEVLDPDGGAALAGIIATGNADGYVVPVRNYSYRPGMNARFADPAAPLTHGAGFWIPSRNVRLYRNDPGYRNEGRYHQSVRGAIEAAGGRVQPAPEPLFIHHYGFLRNDRRKSSFVAGLTEVQIADGPEAWKAHVEHGVALMAAGEMKAAHGAFETAHGLHPVPDTANYLAASHRYLGEPAKGLGLLDLMAEVADDDAYFIGQADLLAERACCHADLQQDEAALADLGRAVILNPALIHARLMRVRLMQRLGQTAVARAEALAVTQACPGLAEGWELLGTIALEEDDLAEAEAALSTALDIAPEQASAGYNLAIALDRMNRPISARRMMRAALAEAQEDWATDELRRDYGLAARSAPVQADIAGGVLHVIPHLSGGGATMVATLAGALAGEHAQAVACISPGSLAGEAHERALSKLGVPLFALPDAQALADHQRALSPAVVIHHWWPTGALDGLTRQGAEQLIVCAAAPAQMPPGYDRYVTLSEFQRNLQANIPAERLVTISNGVDVGGISGAEPADDIWRDAGLGRAGAVRIVMASRLDPDKFYRRLPAILSHLDGLNVELVIAGRGARRYEIAPELAERGLDRWVRFIGPLAHDRVPGFLRSGDLALHLTETHQESHSVVVLEMMAAGLPLVGQPRGCLPEMIEHGVTGYLCSAEAEIAASLRSLICDKSLRDSMSLAARERVARHDVAVFTQSWRQLVAEEVDRARNVGNPQRAIGI